MLNLLRDYYRERTASRVVMRDYYRGRTGVDTCASTRGKAPLDLGRLCQHSEEGATDFNDPMKSLTA